MAMELARLKLATLMRPLLTRLPRGYGAAYGALLGPVGSTFRGDPLFKQSLESRNRLFYDRHLKCHVLGDVGDAGSRNHYILGRYYDNLVPLAIRLLLGPGDTFIDVGANRGVHTLFACRHLTAGRVLSFEPNPRTFQVLQAHLTINGLTNCTPHNLGLSDEPGELRLNLFDDDAPSGCSFIDKGESPVRETFVVPVRRMDEVIAPGSLPGRVLVKVDTEGFEHQVIRGMGALLDRDAMAVYTEIQDDWLRRAGSSARAFHDDMAGRGYRAFLPRVRYRGLVNETLELEPMERMPERGDQYDVLFARPGMVPGDAPAA